MKIYYIEKSYYIKDDLMKFKINRATLMRIIKIFSLKSILSGFCNETIAFSPYKLLSTIHLRQKEWKIVCQQLEKFTIEYLLYGKNFTINKKNE